MIDPGPIMSGTSAALRASVYRRPRAPIAHTGPRTFALPLMHTTPPPRPARRRPLLAAGAASLLLAAVTTAGVSALQTNPRGGEGANRNSAAETVSEGKTAPSLEADLAFAGLGKISQVSVKEGADVKAGEVLMKQDERGDAARLKALQADADVSARVKLAEQKKELADIQLQRQEKITEGGGGNQAEVDEARINAAVAATQILEEKRQGLVAEARADEQAVVLSDKTLKSPVDGVVQKLDAAEGEVFGPQTPAVKVVKIDPLYVKVILVPAAKVEKLKAGQTIQVRYPGEDAWRDAKLLYVEPQVNLALTEPLPFTLELPNPERRPAGLSVQVKLPADAGDVASAG